MNKIKIFNKKSNCSSCNDKNALLAVTKKNVAVALVLSAVVLMSGCGPANTEDVQKLADLRSIDRKSEVIKAKYSASKKNYVAKLVSLVENAKKHTEAARAILFRDYTPLLVKQSFSNKEINLCMTKVALPNDIGASLWNKKSDGSPIASTDYSDSILRKRKCSIEAIGRAINDEMNNIIVIGECNTRIVADITNIKNKANIYFLGQKEWNDMPSKGSTGTGFDPADETLPKEKLKALYKDLTELADAFLEVITLAKELGKYKLEKAALGIVDEPENSADDANKDKKNNGGEDKGKNGEGK